MIFLLLFDIVNLHFATFTNYLYCLLKIKVLDYCLVAFGHKKMQFCPTLLAEQETMEDDQETNAREMVVNSNTDLDQEVNSVETENVTNVWNC